MTIVHDARCVFDDGQTYAWGGFVQTFYDTNGVWYIGHSARQDCARVQSNGYRSYKGSDVSRFSYMGVGDGYIVFFNK